MIVFISARSPPSVIVPLPKIENNSNGYTWISDSSVPSIGLANVTASLPLFLAFTESAVIFNVTVFA